MITSSNLIDEFRHIQQTLDNIIHTNHCDNNNRNNKPNAKLSDFELKLEQEKLDHDKPLLVYSTIKKTFLKTPPRTLSHSLSHSAVIEPTSCILKTSPLNHTAHFNGLASVAESLRTVRKVPGNALNEFNDGNKISLFTGPIEEINLKVTKLQTEWLQLLKQNSYVVPELLSLYQTSKELMLACEQFFIKIQPKNDPISNTKEQCPFLIRKAIKNTLKIAKTLQKAAMDIINSLLNLKILEHVEKLYKNSSESYTLSTQRVSSGHAFWETMNERMQDIFSVAILQIKQDPVYSKFLLSLSAPNQKELIERHIDLLKKRSQLLIFFDDLAKKSHSTFLRHFNQSKQTFTQLSGMQCMGVVIDWGLSLRMNPPKQRRSPSEHFQVFLSFIHKLKIRQFPKVWPCIEILLGEPVCTLQTMEYQRNAFNLFHQTRIQRYQTKTCTAPEILSKSMVLFSKTAPVSVITITLNPLTDADYPPHMIGITQIRLPNTAHKGNVSAHASAHVSVHGSTLSSDAEKTVYRLCDADYGEFEAYSTQAFEVLMTAYFERLHYSSLFCNATLQKIDSALKYLQDMQVKTNTLEKPNTLEKSSKKTPSTVY